MKLPEKLQFLTSTRFWAVVFNAAILYLQQKEILGTAELALVTAIIAPFVAIRTVDRYSEQ